MDEESLIEFQRIVPSITPEGIAGLWMQSNMPAGGRKEQLSLGTLIESVLAEGIRIGKKEAITALNFSPTVSAAIVTLESDIIELERAIKKKNVEGLDLDVWSA
jgi:hypothetical protein